MKMDTLREVLNHAETEGVAIGHFNVSDWVTLKAVFDSARERNVPVIVGVSESERHFLGVRQIAATIKSLREEYDFPVFLNGDHSHSLASAVKAAEAGFDSIVFDLSTLPLEANIRQTKTAVEILKSIRPEILVEGEIGDIGSGSEIHESAHDLSAGLTTLVEARQFVEETKIDILAPAVGNMHGMLKSMVTGVTKKQLDIERIRAIKEQTQVFMTLHGASGTDDRDLRRAIAAGITVIHINTEVRLAWRHGLDNALARRPNEIVPYKVLPQAIDLVKQRVAARLALFSSGALPVNAVAPPLAGHKLRSPPT
jgi:fructose-bisphosphate aldolase, class II